MQAAILLLEDDRSLGETIQDRLLKEGYQVIWCREIAAVRKILKEAELPDLMILDVRLPDGSGFELAAELREKGYGVPFIFLTAQAGAPERLRGFELGAEEFIPKPFHFRELIIRLQHVLSTHKAPEHQASLVIQGFSIDFEQYAITAPDGQRHEVQKRDMALLGFLITEKARVVSRDEILDRLWGADHFPSNRTVDNAIVRLRQAFKPHGPDWIRSVRGVGYQWIAE
ncbi:MAG: response regulator transcription factor [Leptospiraceae bacterium]|nr:response regulator transcription factor [Leptospiraceae bacterium]